MQFLRRRWGALLLVAILSVVVVSQVAAAQLFIDDFEAYRHGASDCTGYPDQLAAENAGWIFGVPWKLVDECELFGSEIPTSLIPFSGSSIQAAYVGYIDPDTGNASYDGIQAADPVLSTQTVSLTAGCQFVEVTFDYWRQVEYYTDGAYDQTWATVTFYAGGVQTGSEEQIFYKDSMDPSLETWTTVDESVAIPAGADSCRVNFNFETVDGYNNDFIGWFIDNVTIDCYDVPPTVCWDEDTPSNLPQGAAGEKYAPDEQVGGYDLAQHVNGGITTDYRFSLAKAGDNPDCDCGYGECVKLTERDPNPLPERLTLSPDGKITGVVESGEQGTYTFWVMVEVGEGRDYSCACHKFTLAIRSDGTGAFYGPDGFDGTGAWTTCGFEVPSANLWHVTQNPTFNCFDLGSYGNVLYFGQDATCDYDTGDRVKGCYCLDLTSQLDTGEYAGYEVEIGFKSFRDVEYYTGGAYDKTYVQVSTDGMNWTTVPDLYWDSRDVSQQVWTWQQALTGIQIPQDDAQLLVRFCFDSVDGYGNDYLGWLVDEVTVWLNPMPITINCCPLPAGFVGEPYNYELTYTGGVPGNDMRVDGLPEGLSVECSSPCVITGTPRAAGTYPVTIYVQGTDASTTCDLVIGEQKCFFWEDFEADPIWTWGGLWRRVGVVDGSPVPTYQFAANPAPPCDPFAIPIGSPNNHVAYFGNTDTNTYATGDRSTGALALLDIPQGIDLMGAQYVDLSFDSCRRVEAFEDGYDRTKVQVRFDTSNEWKTVWYKDSGDPGSTDWTNEEANFGTPFAVPEGATKMWVRFVFDSVDRWYNDYFGWMVDNIRICWADDGGPINPAYSELAEGGPRTAKVSVRNFPNPVEDVHTTTFTVRGEGVDAIRIQIYDLNETLVYEKEIAGNELEWHTDNNYGEYLANGIYFYRAFAKIDGEWVPTDFQKLVILR